MMAGVTEATFYAWKKRYAHLGVSDGRFGSEQPRSRAYLDELDALLKQDSSRANSVFHQILEPDHHDAGEWPTILSGNAIHEGTEVCPLTTS
jgi:hypothetical protein